MKLKTIMFAVLIALTVLATLGVAFAQTDSTQDVCVNCCDGGVCFGQNAGTPTLDVQECLVKINDRTVKNDVTVLKAFDRGEDLEISVEFVSSQMAEDVQVMAFMTGYHRGSKFRDDIFDITPTFDVEPDVSYEKTLNLKLPDDFRLDSGDELKIRIEISDKYSGSYVREYNLKVEAKAHNMVVQDILLDPSSSVEAGRGLFASVRVKNMGDDTENDIKITTSIPALDLQATDYIDQLDPDEATTSEDMFMRLPVCAKAGEYVVKATVEYADGDEVVTSQSTINVEASAECGQTNPPTQEDKTVVSVPGKQDVIKGTSGTVYPVILDNRGVTDRSYSLSVSGLDSWATYRFDPAAFVLVQAGDTKTVYLYVTPKADASTGEKVFMINVETNGESKQIALTANVIEGETQQPELPIGNLKQVLEIGLVVLVVLLIVLGLIIGFSKLKGNGNEPGEVSGQTYY
jgi:hypothetical protein